MSYPSIASYYESHFLSDLRTKHQLLQRINEIKSLHQSLSPSEDKTPEITLEQLQYFANPNNLKGRFRTFTIPKKAGGERIITAPHDPTYQWILRALNEMLTHAYCPSDYAMGFVKGRSVHLNAQAHEGKNYVFNLDLKDFFPSIRQARVCARLQCPPFSLNRCLASTIAGLVVMRQETLSPTETHVSYVLPQGSPVSPLLTNAICDSLDRQLAGLARRFSLTFTRYADDITFSSMHNIYHTEGEFMAELHRIIMRQGFTINDKKTRLQKRGTRQEVTGLVVNHRANVSKQYIASLRNILYIWERYGYTLAFHKWLEHYRQHGPRYHSHHLSMCKVLYGKLNYLRMIRGKNDPTYRTLAQRYKKLTSYRSMNAAYIEGLFVMATHRLLDYELHNRVTCCFARSWENDSQHLPFPYAYFYKNNYRHYAYVKPNRHIPRVEDKYQWRIAECIDGRKKLHLIIYHQDDNVFYVPDEMHRLRMKLWNEQRWAEIMQRQLAESSAQEAIVDNTVEKTTDTNDTDDLIF